MSNRKTAAIVLAAGKGTRMKSALPKVLHKVAHRPMIHHVLGAVAGLKPEKTIVVLAPGMGPVAAAVAPADVAIQEQALGTGNAVMAAREALEGFDGDVLVLFGDTPLITDATLHELLARRRAEDNPAVVVTGFRPADTAAYGRLVLDASGGLDAIVEFREASPEQQAITLCNGGVMAIDGAHALSLLDAIGNDNARGEYYLTDIVAIARRQGLNAAVIEVSEDDVLGVDSRKGLAKAEGIYQRRRRDAAMAAMVTSLPNDVSAAK